MFPPSMDIMKRSLAALFTLILLALALHSLHHAWEGARGGFGSKEPPCPVCQQAGGMAPADTGGQVPPPPAERGQRLWDTLAPAPTEGVSDDRSARGPPNTPA